jgi:hypothetical protein
MPVNTFPGKMEVRLGKKGDKVLVPGQDYIVDPASDGANGLYKIGKKDTNNFCILTPVDRTQRKGVLEIAKGRLVWSVARDTLKMPAIQLKEGVLGKKDKYIHLLIEQDYSQFYKGSNVIGYLSSPANPDSFIVIGAHLDHLGKMGASAVFPGANDNASGIATLLDLARYFSQPEVKAKLRYSIIFIGFGGEEAGLVGSHYFVDNSPVKLSKIKFMINMDLMGNGQDGMMVVNGSVYKTQYDSLVAMNNRGKYLKEIKSRGKAANSDHYWFSEKGVPSFFFYLLGDYPYYHDIYDTPEKPSLKGYDGAFRLITQFIKGL